MFIETSQFTKPFSFNVNIGEVLCILLLPIMIRTIRFQILYKHLQNQKIKKENYTKICNGENNKNFCYNTQIHIFAFIT